MVNILGTCTFILKNRSKTSFSMGDYISPSLCYLPRLGNMGSETEGSVKVTLCFKITFETAGYRAEMAAVDMTQDN